MTLHLARRERPWTSVTVALAATAALTQLPADAVAPRRPELSLVVGAVPFWDRSAALSSADRHARHLDVVSPWSYSVAAGGGVTVTEGPSPGEDSALVPRLASSAVRVVPTLTNTTYGQWDRDTVATILHDPELRSTHVDAVTALVTDNGFAGIQIDYENLQAADRDAFTAFVGELGNALHDAGRELYVTVHPKTDDAGYGPHNQAQDYAAVARGADKVIVMAYDRHWATSTAGPIAPVDWVDQVLRYSVATIGPDKLLLGVGLYGYDWVGSQATPLTWTEVTALAAAHGLDATWDETARAHHFTYHRDGLTHEVWFEDGRSVAAKTALARRHGVAGLALWRLGGEDPSIWQGLDT